MAATIPLLSIWQAPSIEDRFAQAVTIEGWQPEEEALVVAGIRVPAPLPALIVSRRTAGKLPETMGTTTSVRLVSARLREVLERAMGEQVQFLAASVAGSPHGYFVPNLLEHRPGAVGPEGQLVISADDLPPAFRLRELPSIWIVRADLERRLHPPAASGSAGEFVPIHQFRLAPRPRYRGLTEDGWR